MQCAYFSRFSVFLISRQHFKFQHISPLVRFLDTSFHPLVKNQLMLAAIILPRTLRPSSKILRQSEVGKMAVPLFKHPTLCNRSFPAAATRIWNNLPLSVTCEDSFRAFKRALKSHIPVSNYIIRPYIYACLVFTIFLNFLLFPGIEIILMMPRHPNIYRYTCNILYNCI